MPDTELKFDRKQEKAADLGAVQMLHTAGLPAKGLLDFFERGAAQEGIADSVWSIFRTHPISKERLRYLREASEHESFLNMRSFRVFYLAYPNRHPNLNIQRPSGAESSQSFHPALGQMQLYVNYYDREVADKGDNPRWIAPTTDPKMSCPNCKTGIRLTESLAYR